MFRGALVALAALLIAGCSGGRDRTLAELQSDRPEIRALAVRHLAEKFEREDVSLFSQAARDPVPMVRAEAMTALGKTEDPRIVDLLGEALADPEEQVQRAAAAALASFRTDKARSYLTLQYSRRGHSTRMAIVRALKGTNIPGAMASVVVAEAKAIWDRNIKVLSDGTLPERIGAAEELGRSGRPEAVNRLVPLLQDKHVALAAAAARGLGYAGDPRAVPALAALLDENYPELREAACDALGRLGDPSALPQLLALAQEKSPTSSFATRAILALSPSPEVDKALCELALSANEAEALSAGRERRKRGECPLEPILEKLKGSSTVNVGLLAVVALAPKGEAVMARVGALTSSADDETRRLAIEALAELGEPPAAVLIQKAFQAELKALEPRRLDWIVGELPTTFAPGFDPDQALGGPWARTRAQTKELFGRIEALEAQRGREAGKILLEAKAPREVVDDANEEEVRTLVAILRAMGRLKVEDAKLSARPFTKETIPSLRAAAFSGLALLGEDAHEGLFDVERSVQSATAQALVDSGPAGQLLVLDAIGKRSGDRTRLIEPLRGVVPPADGSVRLGQLVKEGGPEAGAAALLLSEMGATQEIGVLLAALDDQQAVARRDVLRALGRLGDGRAVDAVARYLYSESAELRSAAARALAQLKATAQIEAIDALKGDYDLQVRNSATAALQALAGHLPTQGER